VLLLNVAHRLISSKANFRLADEPGVVVASMEHVSVYQAACSRNQVSATSASLPERNEN
jgi:hypothetical protein